MAVDCHSFRGAHIYTYIAANEGVGQGNSTYFSTAHPLTLDTI